MKRPNILILYVDQQRYDALRANGNTAIITPHLDALARGGTNFDHCFVQHPLCMPSRASFLSGQYPGTLGITHMGVPFPTDVPTLPQMLGAHGYVSANIGKLHFLPHANRNHRQLHPTYGFDHLEISDEPGCYEDAYRAWVRKKATQYLDQISCGMPPAAQQWNTLMNLTDTVNHPARDEHRMRAFDAPAELTHSAFVAEQSMEWLDNHQTGDPFLCIAGFYSPHSPWIAPQEFLDLYDPDKFELPASVLEGPNARPEAEVRAAWHGYYAMISEVDHHVGRILACLDELGLADETIVVFTSDHGEWLGEGGRYGKGYPGEDCVSRVPLIVRAPGRNGGETVSRIVEALDVLPTLFESAGLQIPPHLQGRSLWSEDDEERGALMEATGWKSWRTRDYRYIIHEDGRELFYDLRQSPDSNADVSANTEFTAILSEHRRQLLRRLIERERPMERTWPY